MKGPELPKCLMDKSAYFYLYDLRLPKNLVVTIAALLHRCSICDIFDMPS
jgi:hypothetical protein